MKEQIMEGKHIEYTKEKWNLILRNIEKDGVILQVTNEESQILTILLKDGWINASILFSGNEQPIVLKGQMDITDTLLIQNTQNRIALYIGDTLWDEDWPIGKVGYKAALCSSCWAYAEINDDVNEQSQIIVRSSFSNAQNWKPSGFNTHAGDCMPFFNDGVFRLYYLFDRRSHKSKWGLGAHQWAQISSKDLIHWQEQPFAIQIDEQYEGSICTGSVIYHNGLYYAFYAVRMSDGSPAKLTYANSEDGVHFEKTGKVFNLKPPYHGSSARDPKVFCDKNGEFHMLVTTSLMNDRGEQLNGCLAHLRSNDLVNWIQEEPFITLNIEDQPECADYFYWNGWYYLIYSNYGIAAYYFSKKPFGPWHTPKDNIIVDKGYRVPKRDFWKDNRVIFAGWRSEDQNFGGKIVFYEALQKSDGTLSFLFPKEME